MYFFGVFSVFFRSFWFFKSLSFLKIPLIISPRSMEFYVSANISLDSLQLIISPTLTEVQLSLYHNEIQFQLSFENILAKKTSFYKIPIHFCFLLIFPMA